VPIRYVLYDRFVPAQLRRVMAETPCLDEEPVPARFAPGGGIREAFEFPTLVALHAHCLAHPEKNVLYFHSKTHDNMRNILHEGVVSNYERCLECLNAQAVPVPRIACGRFFKRSTPPRPAQPKRAIGWCHFKGNFWWAKCSHVAKLSYPWCDAAVAARGPAPPHFLIEMV